MFHDSSEPTKRPAGRPFKDGQGPRLPINARVYEKTRIALDLERKITGEGLGDLLDRKAQEPYFRIKYTAGSRGEYVAGIVWNIPTQRIQKNGKRPAGLALLQYLNELGLHPHVFFDQDDVPGFIELTEPDIMKLTGKFRS